MKTQKNVSQMTPINNNLCEPRPRTQRAGRELRHERAEALARILLQLGQVHIRRAAEVLRRDALGPESSGRCPSEAVGELSRELSVVSGKVGHQILRGLACSAREVPMGLDDGAPHSHHHPPRGKAARFLGC